MTNQHSLTSLLQEEAFLNSNHTLPLALGRNDDGEPIISNLCEMHNLLIACESKGEKISCLQSIIFSLIKRNSPNSLKLILIDHNKELFKFREIPHLASPYNDRLIGSSKTLQWIYDECERRRDYFLSASVSNVEDYNKVASHLYPAANSHTLDPWEKFYSAQKDFIEDAPKAPPNALPYLTVVINEIADFFKSSSRDYMDRLIDIIQQAHSLGIYFIIATNSPSCFDDLENPLISYICSRISFKVRTSTDSLNILGTSCAENIEGKGYFYYLFPETNPYIYLARVTLIDNREEFLLLRHCIAKATPPRWKINDEYLKKHIIDSTNVTDHASDLPSDILPTNDESTLLTQCLDFAIQEKKISISLLQSKFKLGYGSASLIIREMEEIGVISTASTSSQLRNVLVKSVTELKSFIQNKTTILKPPNSSCSKALTNESTITKTSSQVDIFENLYAKCVAHILITGKITPSSLQRKFCIGYNKASDIIELMHKRGVISLNENKIE